MTIMTKKTIYKSDKSVTENRHRTTRCGTAAGAFGEPHQRQC